MGSLPPITQSSNPDASIQPPTPSNRMKISIIALLVVLGLAGAAAYVLLLSPSSTPTVSSNDAPPSLTVAEESGLKGSFVDKKLKCLKFEDSNIKAFADKEAELKAGNAPVAELKKNLNYLMTTEDISVEKIVNQIEASTAKCIILAYYGSGEKGLEKKFYTYPPENPFIGTVTIDESKKSSFIIPKGRGVIIFSLGASKVYGLQQGTVPAKSRAESISEDLEGWFLVGGTTSDPSEFKEYEERIVTSSVAEGYLTWLKLKKGKNATVGKASTSEQAVQLTAEITSSLTPPILTIAAPDGSPTLAAPFPVKITGKNLTHLDTITLDDPNVTATFKPAVTDYEMSMDVTVQPVTKDGAKTVTLTSKNGTKTTGTLHIAYKKAEGQPKITAISPEVVTLNGKSVSITLTGENLESIESVSFDDMNLKTSTYKTKKEINPINLSEDAKIYGSFEVLIDTNTVKEGVKKLKYVYKGVEKESTFSLVVLKDLDPKNYASIPYIQLATPETYEIGSGPLELDLYGVNLQYVDTSKSIFFTDPVKAFGASISQYAQMTSVDKLSNQHLRIHFADLGKATEILSEKYRLDFKPVSPEKYIDGATRLVTFTSSSKGPGITSITPDKLPSGTGEAISVTIEGKNFNKNTKVSYLLPTGFNDQEKAELKITSIGDTKIELEMTIPGYGYGFYPELRVENEYGVVKKEILVKENENVKPVIEKITPATAEFNFNKPTTLTITGKRLDKMKYITINTGIDTPTIKDAKIESAYPEVVSVSLTPFYSMELEKIPAKSEMNVTLSGTNGKVVKSGGFTLLGPKFAPKTITSSQQGSLTYIPYVVLTITGENMELAKSGSIMKMSGFDINIGQTSMSIIDSKTVKLDFYISKLFSMPTPGGQAMGTIVPKITFAENSADIDGKTVDRIVSPIQIVAP